MIEIVRALAQGSRFVILDEPTAQLVSSEIETLDDPGQPAARARA